MWVFVNRNSKENSLFYSVKTLKPLSSMAKMLQFSFWTSFFFLSPHVQADVEIS